MRIPLPRQLDPRQPDADTRGLSLVTPSVSASESDDSALVIELNGTEHRVPSGWSLAEGKHHESDIAILRRGSEVRVLVGDREGRIREVVGYSASTRRSILEHRFGEEAQPTPEQREVDRLSALSDSIAPTGVSDAEVERLVALADAMGSSDDAEVTRLSKLADGL